jgi:hypothetical protein
VYPLGFRVLSQFPAGSRSALALRSCFFRGDDALRVGDRHDPNFLIGILPKVYDILFQNTDGTPAIWEMNGTSVINQVALTNPGPS